MKPYAKTDPHSNDGGCACSASKTAMWLATACLDPDG